MTNSNNQFFDLIKNFVNPEFFVNVTKNMPVMDFSSFTNVMKKNAEVLTSTNQMVAESMQSIIKRSSEVVQNSATDLFDAIKNTTAAQDIEQAAACHQDYLKSALENSMNNAKELIDMSSKSSIEIFEVVGKNLKENVDKVFNNKDKKKA